MKWLRCAKCRELKHPDDFPLKPSNVSGRSGYCLICRPPAPEPEKPAPVPERIAYAMCGKKRRYRTHDRAMRALLQKVRNAPQLRIYQCPLCKGWHLTHKPQERAS